MITIFENFNDIDPFGEENWGKEKIISLGYTKIKIIYNIMMYVSFRDYINDDDYIKVGTKTLFLNQGDELWVDINDYDDNDIYFNVQLKDEYYVGTVHLPIKSFDIVN